MLGRIFTLPEWKNRYKVLVGKPEEEPLGSYGVDRNNMLN
jgi:hypothetical protein